MEQGIYVDVLLVTNYIINMLLIACVGKLSGRSPKRRRIVAAALFGAVTSLTIFLPFMGFLPSVLIKLAISAAIVLIAFSYISPVVFLKQIFLFFAVSFAFAGVMLGIWLAFTPSGMTYYNGVVYFDISPVVLIVTTIAAYVILLAAGRFAKGRKPAQVIYKVTVFLGDKSAILNGLVDTGNHLREPFSDIPVVVCSAGALEDLLPRELVKAVQSRAIFGSGLYSFGLRMRMVPYSNVGGSGVIPAFKADRMVIETQRERLAVEQVYVGLSAEPVGDGRYNCLLSPDLIGLESLRSDYSQPT